MLQDLRFGLRALARRPLFTCMAAGSLALGIAACTVIFSVVYTLLLAPLPYPHPEQLVHVGMASPAFPGQAFGGLTPDVLGQLRDDAAAGFTALAGSSYDYSNLTGAATPAQLTVIKVTADFFRVFGVPPRLGRTFLPADCRADSAPTVVLSDEVWRTQFHAAAGIIGQSVTLSDRVCTVIGVMPADFKTPLVCDLWTPLNEASPEMQPATTRRLVTVGRLSAGGAAGRRKLDAVLETVSAGLARSQPEKYRGWHLGEHALGTTIVGLTTQRALWLLLGAVGCVLLVTCANVANLQLVRGEGRRREIGVRLALGASRARIIRYSLAESLLLAAVGGGLAVLASAWGVDAVKALLPPGTSPWQEQIRLSWPVLGFSAAAAVLAGGVTGLLPAWAAARREPAGVLSAGGSGRGASDGPGGGRTRAVLVVAEMTLALVLLAGAGLMGRSLLAASRTSAGMRLERTLLIDLSLSDARYPDAARTAEFYRRVLAAVGTVPGVAGTALTTTAPFNWAMDFNFLLPGQTAGSPEAARQSADYDAVNPDFFRTLEVPLLLGRALDARDAVGTPPVAVVNQAFVRRFLPTGEVLGRKIISSRGVPFEIVGVAGDVRRDGLDQAAPPEMYVSCLQRPAGYAALHVRAAGALSAESLTLPVEQAIWQIDPDQPIGKVTTLEHAAFESITSTRLYAVLFGTFAALTLSLAALGIYGTVAYSIGQRTREIGIRMALGAQRRDVLRLVLGQGVRLILTGLALGVALSLALARLVASLLFGVEAHDPATLFLVALLLGSVALLASYLPARRATRIDPLTALREE